MHRPHLIINSMKDIEGAIQVHALGPWKIFLILFPMSIEHFQLHSHMFILVVFSSAGKNKKNGKKLVKSCQAPNSINGIGFFFKRRAVDFALSSVPRRNRLNRYQFMGKPHRDNILICHNMGGVRGYIVVLFYQLLLVLSYILIF